MRTVLVVLGICACGGGGARTPAPAPKPVVIAPLPPPPPDDSPAIIADSHEPELYPPAWKQVGIGQTISFSTSAIDQDLDETRVDVAAMPKSATFDAITQTITWTPTKADAPKAEFTLTITQPKRNKTTTKMFSIDVLPKPQPAPVAAVQSPLIETVLLIHDPKRLAQVNKDWPIDRLLEVGAETFKLQFPPDKRKLVTQSLDAKTAYAQMLTGLAHTHGNARLDPALPEFDKAAFGDPKSWKIVAFRPRIDKAWTELRVVYQAMNAREPVFAMFRLRPVVEYVPALPRADEERDANNKIFLQMVARCLMKDGGPDPMYVKDPIAHGKSISTLMTDVMMFDDTKTKPYLHGFEIGIALEARMGGGSTRNADGSYKSGDGWGWSAMKPFQHEDHQAYVNVAIPGFWTDTQPTKDGKSWGPKCAARFDVNDPRHLAGYDVLCRKTMGLVDLPATNDDRLQQMQNAPSIDGAVVTNGKIDANNLFFSHKKKFSVEHIALEDGRRDLGEENGITCSQCHIRNFGMHDFSDPANTDPSKGTPKAPNHALQTLNFQIIPSTTWEPFMLEFLQYQECRGKMLLTQYLGADAAKGLTCPLAK